MKRKSNIVIPLILVVMAVLIIFLLIACNRYREKVEVLNRQLASMYIDQNSDNNGNEENQYTYPQGVDDNNGISVLYTASVLSKKSMGESLNSEEEELIMYHHLQKDGYGLAITHFHEHDGGMGKATRRIWETADGGESWNVLYEQIYGVGIFDYVYIDNVFIEANFNYTSENGYFYISDDRGHKFRSVAFKDIFDYDGKAYVKKVDENTHKKTVTYEWIDFHTKEVITTVEYDMKLNVVSER